MVNTVKNILIMLSNTLQMHLKPQKSAKATGDLICNKTADRVTRKGPGTLPSKMQDKCKNLILQSI